MQTSYYNNKQVKWTSFKAAVIESQALGTMKLPIVIAPLHRKTCQPMMLSRAWQLLRRALSLQHSPSQQFACSQWQTTPRPSMFYYIYRWMLFVGALSVAVTSFLHQQLPPGFDLKISYWKWFIYFTNWGVTLIVLQSGLALAVVHKYRFNKCKKLNSDYEEEDAVIPRRQQSPMVCRAYWLAHNVATDLAFVITLIYWTLVHDPKIHINDAINVLVHGGNTVVVLCELAVTSHPIRCAHAVYSVGAGVTYGVFSAVYWAAGGTSRLGYSAIYPSLDWDKPSSALLFVTLCAVVMLVVHAVTTGLAATRSRLAAHLRLGPNASNQQMALPTH